MTSDVAGPDGPLNQGAESRAPAGTGRYMLTLCHLDSPVTIRQPESPHLKPYTFFVGRAQQQDAGPRLFLHMGYFETLAEAQKWVHLVRNRYPHASASLAPEEFLRPPKSEAAALTPTATGPLSDTQVMNVLEARGGLGQQSANEDDSQIPLVRPEDTGTRRVLKEAVATGAPVSFAVQLQWSEAPIDPTRAQSLAVFKGYLLYVTESYRDGRARYFLRVGFFTDPAAARQVAFQVRSKFAGAAVVPVTDQERQTAREPKLAAFQANASRAALDKALNRKALVPKKSSKLTGRLRGKKTESLDETLEMLAEKEMWADPDTTSESGVRHLKVTVQAGGSERS